jgi:predicted peptidase
VSDVIAAESWLSVMPIAPNVTAPDGVPEWDIDPIMTIVKGVQAQYGTDPNRIYVSGYSMVCNHLVRSCLSVLTGDY